MQCPTCAKQADCIDSREKDYARRRRYKCECGFRFSTLELVEDINNLITIESMANNVRLSGARAQWVAIGKEIAKKELRELLAAESIPVSG